MILRNWRPVALACSKGLAPPGLLILLFVGLIPALVEAACSPCTTFAGGEARGIAAVKALTEASGIAASRRNPGVVWTHNDGSSQTIFALNGSGARLASFAVATSVGDTEDIAVGPGPVQGQPYLYYGDIGGNVDSSGVRPSVTVVRMPEPYVDLAWVTAPHSPSFDGEESFTLVYPDGSYDAETLMVDPATGDVLVGTKQNSVTRMYRANLMNAQNKATIQLEFLCSVAFSKASAGDISLDGSQLALRREDLAMVWARCPGESVATAFSRTGTQIPVVGPPTEPNGEGFGFLPDGTGYLTISEGVNPVIYFFQALCPVAPLFAVGLSNMSVLAGRSVEFQATAVGFPAPSFSWSFNDATLPGRTNSTLLLTNVSMEDSGQYQLVASNASGTVSSSAMLTVRPKPDLRITEVQSAEAPSPGVPTADWWELTSFEAEPVSLEGWRFNDSSGGLTDPFVFTNALTISPGESMVFVEGLTAPEFRNWWGTENVPDSVQIVSYSGSGLSFSAQSDGIRLWSITAADTNDTIASVDFGAAQAGFSFNYDPLSGAFGATSQVGVNGAFQAASAPDIGSPGRILAPISPPSVRIKQLGSAVRLDFEAAAGRRYLLQSREDMAPGVPWEPTGDVWLSTNSQTGTFQKPLTTLPRFYRIEAQ